MPHLFDEIEAEVAEEMATIVETVAVDIREEIGVPVGYRIGPEGGTYKIRSKPGEKPRKDSGELQDEIVADVTREEGIVTGTVDALAPHAVYVEAIRPFMDPAARRWEPVVIERIVAAVGGGNAQLE
jgi:hypothetical protein